MPEVGYKAAKDVGIPPANGRLFVEMACDIKEDALGSVRTDRLSGTDY